MCNGISYFLLSFTIIKFVNSDKTIYQEKEKNPKIGQAHILNKSRGTAQQQNFLQKKLFWRSPQKMFFCKNSWKTKNHKST